MAERVSGGGEERGGGGEGPGAASRLADRGRRPKHRQQKKGEGNSKRGRYLFEICLRVRFTHRPNSSASQHCACRPDWDPVFKIFRTAVRNRLLYPSERSVYGAWCDGSAGVPISFAGLQFQFEGRQIIFIYFLFLKSDLASFPLPIREID
ncbi:hypothetical protein HNY73_021086 [Argiope bruennichi]|uniref:Uncharacterized protein n=1 Tax=Argiope bruennichi TaxID=94029 RepID=A0A8T0EA60_ARGBR|nr:hypothetical protein HNY73_021086 [Argiope bruennichi]